MTPFRESDVDTAECDDEDDKEFTTLDFSTNINREQRDYFIEKLSPY